MRLNSKIALLVGDPQQLMPTLSSDLSLKAKSNHGLELTLFERLAQDEWLVPKLLRIQYRCHPEIANVSNNLFYDSKLVNGPNTCRTSLVDGLSPLTVVLTNGHEVKDSHSGSFKNLSESRVVLKCVNSFILHGVDPKDIGVVCFCIQNLNQDKSQVELIKFQFEKEKVCSSLLVSTGLYLLIASGCFSRS
jgi:superfamily I DNA and/or RNA helicase